MTWSLLLRLLANEKLILCVLHRMISFSHDDKEFVGRLAETCQTDPGSQRARFCPVEPHIIATTTTKQRIL